MDLRCPSRESQRQSDVLSQSTAFYVVCEGFSQCFLFRGEAATYCEAQGMRIECPTRRALGQLVRRFLGVVFMSRFRSVTLRSGLISGCGLVFILLLTLLSSPLQSQQTASLHGAIHDSQGKPVASATVRLQPSDLTQAQTVHADLQGNYNFPELREGVYILRAEMHGLGTAEIPSLFIGPKENKTVDLTLLRLNTSAAPSAARQRLDGRSGSSVRDRKSSTRARRERTPQLRIEPSPWKNAR